MGMGSVTFDFGNQELLGRSRINMNQRGAGTLVARTDFFFVSQFHIAPVSSGRVVPIDISGVSQAPFCTHAEERATITSVASGTLQALGHPPWASASRWEPWKENEEIMRPEECEICDVS